MSEKTIVCFGDSNTYGRIAPGGRFDWQTRYPGVLSRLLGPDYHVIEEGCGGRTTVFDDPAGEGWCGKDYLIPCLWSHRPVELVIFMLGTNDSKGRFSASAEDITEGMERLILMTRRSGCGPDEGAPKILLLAPVQMGKLGELAGWFIGAQEKISRLPQLYQRLAARYEIPFINAGDYAAPDPRDGVHMTAEGHRALANACSARVKQILEETSNG